MKFNKYALLAICSFILLLYLILLKGTIQSGYVSNSVSNKEDIVFQGIPIKITTNSSDEKQELSEGASVKITYLLNGSTVKGIYDYDVVKNITLNKYSVYKQQTQISNDINIYLLVKYLFLFLISVILFHSFLNVIFMLYENCDFTETSFYQEDFVIAIIVILSVACSLVLTILVLNGNLI